MDGANIVISSWYMVSKLDRMQRVFSNVINHVDEDIKKLSVKHDFVKL